jgi:hypothetical protein
MPAKKNKRRPAEALRPSTTRTPPAFVTPMAAQIVKSLPDGDEWIYDEACAIRCLDCGTVLCRSCAKDHFKESKK